MKLNILSACKARLSGQDTTPDNHNDCAVAQDQEMALEESPEARAERVAALRDQVRSGTYDIPVTQLVQILASIFFRKS